MWNRNVKIQIPEKLLTTYTNTLMRAAKGNDQKKFDYSHIMCMENPTPE